MTIDWTQVILAVIGLATAYLGLQMKQMHTSVNSKMDEMMKLVRSEATAEGHLAGVEAEKSRRAIEDQAMSKGQLKEKSRQGVEDADFLRGKEATKLDVNLNLPTDIKKKLDLP